MTEEEKLAVQRDILGDVEKMLEEYKHRTLKDSLQLPEALKPLMNMFRQLSSDEVERCLLIVRTIRNNLPQRPKLTAPSSTG